MQGCPAAARSRQCNGSLKTNRKFTWWSPAREVRVVLPRFGFVTLLVMLSARLVLAESTPSYVWVRQGGGEPNDYVNAIGVDASGNVYITGLYNNSATFGSVTLNSAVRNSDDVFLVKYNSAGTVVWGRSAGGSQAEEAYGLALDAVGNILIAGRFRGTATFGSFSLTSAGSHDMFLAKYDANGTCLWVRRAGGPQLAYANAVATDAAGNVFVTGVYSNTMNFGTVTLTNPPGTPVSREIFLAKYDGNGNFRWARSAGGWDTDVAFHLATDPTGNVIITGHTTSTNYAFGPIAFESTGAGQDVFVAKYDTAGNVLWARNAGGSDGYHYSWAVATDSAGNIYITGIFEDTIWFGSLALTSATAGNGDIFLVKYDANGNVIWARQAGGIYDDQGFSVATDSSGNVLVAGGFYSPTCSFGSVTLTNAGGNNGKNESFLAKYTGAGTLLWAQRAGGVEGDYMSAVAVGPQNAPHVTGVFYGTATFGTNTLTSAGRPVGSVGDVFTARLAAPGTPPTLSDIPHQATLEDVPPPPIAFTVGSPTMPAAHLVVTAISLNTNILPQSALSLGGSGSNRTLTITLPADVFGAAGITVTVTDTNNQSTTKSFTLTIVPVNDPPTLDPLSDLSLDEDAPPQIITLTGIGRGATNEADTLTVTATVSHTNLLAPPVVSYTSPNATGTLTLTFRPHAFGTSVVTVVVNDGMPSNNIVSRSFTVTVLPVNDSPFLSGVPWQAIFEDTTSAPIPFVIGDVETPAGALTVQATAANSALIPASGLVLAGANSNRTVTITPAPDQFGFTSITLTVRDPDGGGASTNFTLTVHPVNDPPTLAALTNITLPANAPEQTIVLMGISPGAPNETELVSLTATSSVPALIPHPVVAYTNPATTGILRFQPVPGATGVATLTVLVNDGMPSNNILSRSFIVTVEAVGTAPSISAIADQVMQEDEAPRTLAFTVADAETPAASLTVTASSVNTNLFPQVNLDLGGSGSNRTVRLWPARDQFGSNFVTLTVTDADARSASTSFRVVVQPVNDPPTLDPIADVTMPEDGGLRTIALTGIGPGAANETNLLTVTAQSGNPAVIPHPSVNYTAGAATGLLSFTPQPNAFGSALITVTVNDNQPSNNILVRTFTVTVTPVNDAPVAVGQSVSTPEDTPRSLTLTGSDVDGDGLTFLLSSTPAHGSLSGFNSATGAVVYTPATNFFGADSFTFRVTDGVLTSVVATVSLTVVPVNDPPTLDELADLEVEENSGPHTVLLTGITPGAPNELPNLSLAASSSRPELIPHPVVEYTNPASSGRLQFVPAPGQSGVATLTVTVRDDGGTDLGGKDTVTRSFQVIVTPAPAQPPELWITRESSNPVVCWRTNTGGFTLMATRRLSAEGSWLPVPAAPALRGDHYALANPPGQRSSQFFRLDSAGVTSTGLLVTAMGTNAVIRWPTNLARHRLHVGLQPGDYGPWWRVPQPPAVVGGDLVLTNALETSPRYFRLTPPSAPCMDLTIMRAGDWFVLQWPTNLPGILQASPTLGPGGRWVNVPVVPTVIDDCYFVTNTAPLANEFYRVSTLPETPQLEISVLGTNLALAWSTNARGYRLQFAEALTDPMIWQMHSHTPVMQGAHYVVTTPLPQTIQFYRLLKLSVGPPLRITRTGATMELSWCACAPGFVLQSADAVEVGSAWVEVLAPPTLVDTEYQVQLEAAPAHRFFRLFAP